MLPPRLPVVGVRIEVARPRRCDLGRRMPPVEVGTRAVEATAQTAWAPEDRAHVQQPAQKTATIGEACVSFGSVAAPPDRRPASARTPSRHSAQRSRWRWRSWRWRSWWWRSWRQRSWRWRSWRQRSWPWRSWRSRERLACWPALTSLLLRRRMTSQCAPEAPEPGEYRCCRILACVQPCVNPHHVLGALDG